MLTTTSKIIFVLFLISCVKCCSRRRWHSCVTGIDSNSSITGGSAEEGVKQLAKTFYSKLMVFLRNKNVENNFNIKDTRSEENVGGNSLSLSRKNLMNTRTNMYLGGSGNEIYKDLHRLDLSYQILLADMENLFPQQQQQQQQQQQHIQDGTEEGGVFVEMQKHLQQLIKTLDETTV